MIYKLFAFGMFFCFGYAVMSGEIAACMNSVFDGAGSAVTLLLTLAGMLCFWNGTVNIIKSSRFLSYLSHLLSPLVKFIFPSASKNTDLSERLSLFVCANALGIGNAATPIALGIMKELDDKNEKVNDDMVMLCLVSTAPISLIPTTVISLLQESGFPSPLSILPYVWLCSLISFVFSVFIGKAYCALRRR